MQNKSLSISLTHSKKALMCLFHRVIYPWTTFSSLSRLQRSTIRTEVNPRNCAIPIPILSFTRQYAPPKS